MAYNLEKIAKLLHVKQLGERVKQQLTAITGRVKDLEDAGGEPNKIESIKVNGTAQTITSKAVNITVPTKTSQLTNDAKYQTEEEVNAKISSTYKPGGSKTFATLPTPAEAVLGMVYNVADAFTTTATFIEGAGKAHPAGTNVVVIKDGSAYKYDVLSGFVDLTPYVTKETGKGLSTNDYTTAEKQKLAGLHNDAMTAATASAAGKAGFVPAPPAGSQAKFLRGDGTWVVPTNTTYQPATAAANGLMSKEDKAKIDGIDIATDDEVDEMLNELFASAS